jgi:hypothetical protein
METTVARKMWRTLEPYHSMIYFSPIAAAAYAELGVTGRAGYFASRAAPLGPVPASVVIATFFNFKPALVEHSIPSAWASASPGDLLAARLESADRQLSEIVGADALVSLAMAEAADLARAAADVCSSPGRALYAAHAALDWPDQPHLALWHAVTLLREFRGDGHIAALVAEGLDPVEALVTHGATATVPPGVLQASRGWSDEDWAAAQDRLKARGWFADGALTPAGDEVRARIERTTDELAMAPWQALGDDDSARLRTLVRPWSRAVADSGIFINAGQYQAE